MKIENMSLSEWFWSKVGFGCIGILSGSIWCLIFFPLIQFISPDVSSDLVFKVFIICFVSVGLLSEKMIGHAGIGALFALYGFVVALIGSQSGTGPDIDTKKMSQELIVCVLLGCLSALIIVVVN